MKRVISVVAGNLLLEECCGKLIRCIWTDKPLAGESSSVLDEAERQLREYLDGSRQAFDIDIELRGTDFQRRVWRALAEIPYGSTRTYGQIAERIGCLGGQRAVAQACSRNQLCVIIPCHRVVAAGGGIGGYTAPDGIVKKRFLLSVEQDG